MNPSLAALKRVSATLEEAGLEHALGGSGLLVALGLHQQSNDWDLTTEASLIAVTDALAVAAVPFVRLGGSVPFASRFLLVATVAGTQLDLIGRFAIHSEGGVCRIPTISCMRWNGVPVGSPEAWAVAYALMGREEKANLLFRYLAKVGADPLTVDLLLQEPLPPGLVEQVRRWHIRKV
ncbi:hypothetical protein CEN49_26460 [Fischerella thermalis CCMEE 5273]|nr:hypothetical protein CEN49_26460 [Fischerella thermalis CCMEE 5273]